MPEENNNQINDVRALFENAKIPQRLWFTKYGYYKIYNETRYLYSFIFQVLFFIAALNGFSRILQGFIGDAGFDTTKILHAFLFSSIAAFISDLALGDNETAFKWFVITCGLGVVVFKFI